MKKLTGFFSLFLLLFLSSCSHVVDYVLVPVIESVVSMVSYEMGGTQISESEYFHGTKKQSDWLFVFYISADNSLDYSTSEWPLFNDLNEVEYGLYEIRNQDGTPKSNTNSVRCVALWDGSNHGNTHLFELGADTTSGLFGNNTYEITGVEFIEDANNNVNMSDYRTLKNYLGWVKNKYDYTNIALVVGSHGGGAGGPSSYITRAMIQDDTSSPNASMSSLEFSTALYDAGFGGNKLDLLILDVCLGGNLEDAYQFKGYANYMICSPANTPGAGNNYTKIIESFNNNKGIDSKELGKKICQQFKNEYSNYNGVTITMVDLSKVGGCFTYLNTFAQNIPSGAYDDLKTYLPACSYRYDGTYCISYDAAQMALMAKSKYSGCGSYADSFITSLETAIVYSWRRGCYDGENVPYGLSLTLMGRNTVIPQWYTDSTNMAFASNKWVELIKTWYGQ